MDNNPDTAKSTDDRPATIEDIQAAVTRAYQVGRLEVMGQVNIQRVRAMKERYETLLAQMETSPSDELCHKLLRHRKRLLQACQVGVRNEHALNKLLEN